MNEETIKRLKNNPFYKPSKKQLEEMEKEKMETFGDVHIRNDSPEIHKPKVIRK